MILKTFWTVGLQHSVNCLASRASGDSRDDAVSAAFGIYWVNSFSSNCSRTEWPANLGGGAGRFVSARLDSMRNTLLAFLLACSLHGAPVMRIACGSSSGGTDSAGTVWQSDAYFQGGAVYSRADMAALGVPYRALRNGPSFAYNIPLPNGDYTVKLHWVEVRTAASSPAISTGQRKFDVAVGGSVVAASLDLFAAAGSFMPYAQSFPVTVSGGVLTISETANAGSLGALLSGIAVDSVDPPPALPFAPYATGTTLAVPQCPAIGLTFAFIRDTGRLYWCFEGSGWNPVSDLVLGPSIFQVKQVDACQGGAVYTTSDGQSFTWDCTGMYRAILARMDGTYLSLVGENIDLPSAAYGITTWLPAK